MINVAEIGTADMRMTTKMIAEQALQRGWKVELYYKEGSHMRVHRADGKAFELYSASLPEVSHVWALRSNDKYFTTTFLQEQGLPVPETHLVAADDIEQGSAVASRMFSAGKKCVVKPLDAGHGDGITVAITSLEQLNAAFAYARPHSPKLIVQEYFENPVDIRLTCINYTFQAGLVRIPASVQGDGVHTLSELIDIANATGRGKSYTSKLTVISRSGAELFLGEKGLRNVPSANEVVQVVGTANVGTGGETLDVTDELPAWLKAQAEQAARSMQLPVCGVDFLLSTMPTPQATEADLQPVIIELNQCPSLFIHEMPIHGRPRPVVAAFLDYLATL